MKIRMPLIAACVFVVGAGTPHGLHAAESSPSTTVPPHQKMQDDANASAQAGTDMSYGGTSETRSESGGPAHQRCSPHRRCGQ